MASNSPDPLNLPPDPKTRTLSRERRHRLPLGSTRRRLPYERRIRLWLLALALPSILTLATLAYSATGSAATALAVSAALAVLWLIAAASFFEQLIRPLQTLANVVASLREEDFSFRARGALRGDALGDLAMEVNSLAATLQRQRSAAQDALTLVERVMMSMETPVLAFGPDQSLLLLNSAAELAFGLTRETALQRSATDLHLVALLAVENESLYAHPATDDVGTSIQTRWSVRRTTFRLHGVPHTLLVLSDVAAVLREEERLAWQRLIRVLSHEINNSLTPIKSIAGSLRTRLSSLDPGMNPAGDLHRGLAVIEERAASLHRFLQAYQQLTRLPPLRSRELSLRRLLEQVTALETRLAVTLDAGPDVRLWGDPDQLQHLLINLINNAAEASLAPEALARSAPQVSVGWCLSPLDVVVHVLDSGSGLTNPANLFVPFYTTKPNGSGIGLALARQIAVAHRGSITLVNRQDSAGCRAELRLPLQTSAEGTARRRTESERSLNSKGEPASRERTVGSGADERT